MDVAATAGGLGKAVYLVVNDVRPKHGVIAIHFQGSFSAIAMIQAIEVGPGSSPTGTTPLAFPFPPDINRLGNPGFEQALAGDVGSNGETHAPPANTPWRSAFPGPNQGGIWPETAFNIHADWGLPKPRSGKDAMRTYAMEKDAHTQVYQDVPVSAQTSYRASAWVQTVDLDGKGFGTHAGDRPACA